MFLIFRALWTGKQAREIKENDSMVASLSTKKLIQVWYNSQKKEKAINYRKVKVDPFLESVRHIPIKCKK